MEADTYKIELDVLTVQQPLGEFYIASIPARDLVEITYADVRRLVSKEREVERYLGIQRPLSKRRVKQIKKYIEGSDATFPTAVIVAIDERCAKLEHQTKSGGVLTLTPYLPTNGDDEEEIPWDRIAKVLDGQHRIAAFMDENNEFNFMQDEVEFDINLSIFIGADIADQANVFATVNLAQTKVNRSLAYDLTELAKTPSPQKTCHNIAVALDEEETSSLYERIKRLGTATPGRSKEPLTQAAFVEALLKMISVDPVADRNQLLDGKKLKRASIEELEKCPFRNLFIAGKDTDIAEILFNYFEAVRKKWPDSWDDLHTKGNLLPKSNAFKALMKFLHVDVYPNIVGEEYGNIPTTRQFSYHFRDLKIKDSDFTTKNFVPGSGGQSTFLKMLRGELTIKDLTETK